MVSIYWMLIILFIPPVQFKPLAAAGPARARVKASPRSSKRSAGHITRQWNGTSGEFPELKPWNGWIWILLFQIWKKWSKVCTIDLIWVPHLCIGYRSCELACALETTALWIQPVPGFPSSVLSKTASMNCRIIFRRPADNVRMHPAWRSVRKMQFGGIKKPVM